MENNYFIKKYFYKLIIENDFIDAYHYLLKTNNIEMILKYLKKYKKLNRLKNNHEISNTELDLKKLINNLHLYYFKKLIYDKSLIGFEFEEIKQNVKKISNIYYLINNDDIIIWKEVNVLSIECRLLECVYRFQFYVISNFIFKGFINYISLNNISLNYFIFNDNLYINKNYYQKNLKSKKFKLFLISQAQYVYDLKSKKYTYEEELLRKEKIVEIYKNNS